MPRKKSILTLLSLLSLLLMPLQTIPVKAAASGPTCQQYSVPVNLSETDTTTYHVAGWLCWRGTLQGKTVQFLEHGATYDHNYWQWPQQPSQYSYAQTATAAGYATFAIDRLGIGQSDHPDPNLITLPVGAHVAHQIVQALRHGDIGHTTFSAVISVGHSAGSAIALLEASTYHDVAGLMVTGLLHTTTSASSDVLNDFYPANQDPKFAGMDLADGYLTTVPGTRGTLFYNTSFAKPEVIARDEQLKQTVTMAEFAGIGLALDPAVSRAVSVPVLVVVGQQDTLFCNESEGLFCADNAAIKTREQSSYGPQACLEAYVLPRSGHSSNVHPNAQLSYANMLAWSYRHVGNGIVPPLQPCRS